jgi:hypothetical protein
LLDNLRYKAFVQLEVSNPGSAGVVVTIQDPLQGGTIASATKSYVAPGLLADTIAIEWEVAGVAPGNHVVSVTLLALGAGVIVSTGQAYLAVDEIA